MPPISLGTSHSQLALETGQAKLWVLLIGVNEYQDVNLPQLSYPAFDCQGLGESLITATQAFPQKDITLHHDFAPQKPILETVQSSLERIVSLATTEDTILFYFSGHGLLETQSQETVLCLANTQKNELIKTGLTLQYVLKKLSQCSAHCQVIWLDACHCGNMTLTGAKEGNQDILWDNPTAQLLETLRKRAAKSKGFYALLSCDQGQKSWEFPDLGHGVFSYFLMRGLQGEAADAQGLIKADGLYQYVYHQTLNYIDKVNQQLRLINQQKRYRRESHLYSEYSLQTPKRIVEGVGELILGLKSNHSFSNEDRHALIVDSCRDRQTTNALKKILKEQGNFTVTFISTVEGNELKTKEVIQLFLNPKNAENKQLNPFLSRTLLLYIRGKIEEEIEGDSYLILEQGIKISRSWLRQELRRSNVAQQIVILDGQGQGSIEEWIEELKLFSDHGQCLLGAINLEGELDLFSQILLESLISVNPKRGLSAAQWLNLLKNNCEQLSINFVAWVSETQCVIDILPVKSQDKQLDTSSVKLTSNSSDDSVLESSSDLEIIESITDSSQSDGFLFSAERLADLSEFLTELIGPVAIPLLQSTLTKTQDQIKLISTLENYLSSSQKVKFKQWMNRMTQETNKLNEPVVSSPDVQAEKGSHSQVESHHVYLPSYSQIESMLKEIIGPIASLLLSQINDQEWCDPDRLITHFKHYLTSSQRIELEKQLVMLFQKDKNSTEITVSEEEPSPPNPLTIDERFLQECKQELTRIIGPVAPLIIDSILKENPQIERQKLIEAIAAMIPDSQQSAHFCQHWPNIK